MNRLARERSPYLLQHAQNPVDWYPWGDEAFARARLEDKPIFLSIGYSTCHWCHVMEHESFEHAAVAAVLNEHFVAIKVDREERPDVDRVYMTFVQATTGSGGWPMSVWLTPDLKPFYGGTYFPPESKWGRPGFVDILQEIARVWKAERGKVVESADALTARLRSMEQAVPAADVPGAAALDKTVQQFRDAFDPRNGGFGDAPKFPRPSELLFLMREHARVNAPQAAEMVLRTLRAMALGGMRDHIGGGFYSAEDADSIPPEEAGAAGAHKKEGAFYLWRAAEVDALLGDQARIAKLRLGIEPDGNAPHDPQQEFTGKNLLYVARSIDDIAKETGTAQDDVVDVLHAARLKMFKERLGRPRPQRDDKILAAWNGLMIGAFARMARALRGLGADGREAGRPYLEAARRAAAFIRERMWNAHTGVLLRRYRDGDAAIDGYAEDYAYMISGLLELFQADPQPMWLEWAIALQRRQDEWFWDDEGGGWFSTTGHDPSVLLRMKEDYDGAEPTASSVSVHNLLTLSHLVSDAQWNDRIERTLRVFATRLEQMGRGVPMMAAALSAQVDGVQQIVIVEGEGASGTADDALDRFVAMRHLPFAIQLRVTPESQRALAGSLPLVAAMQPVAGITAAYVCRDFTCRPPVTTIEALEQELGITA